jgi:hypothetical protein
VTGPVAADRPPLPDTVVALTDSLQRGVAGVLGRGFAGLFLYGALAFPRPEHWLVDVDFHVLVRKPLTDAQRADVRTRYATLAHASELGTELDGYYVLLSEAARAEPPRHQLDLTMRDEAWALHRAHVLAGRYFLVAGLDPRDLVPEPTWAELEAGLRAEMRFVDTHPRATAFGILNGARILYSFEKQDVVVSKYEAGQWALASLPAEWHAAVHAALRSYEQAAAAGDARTLEESWAPFVAYVNRSLPAT